MLAVSLPVAIVAYLVGIFFAGVGLFYQQRLARNTASACFVVGWLAQLVVAVERGRALGQFPLTNLPEYLLLLGWAIMTLHLVLWFRGRVTAAGLLLPPLAALAAIVAWPLVEVRPHPVPHSGGWFLVHTTIATLGMAMLCVSLAMSVIYLLQDRALKGHRTLHSLERLPSLERADSIAFQALWIGFALLSIGIATGFLINAVYHDRVWTPGAKQTFPLLAWAIFAAVLVARLGLGVRGRKQAYLTIMGVMLCLLTVLGMTL